ncbi:hypothetical protein FPQ18DRAFT_339692 [Pyronema domesticum]|uniref:Similar to Uncharacterized protein yisB acc. no. O06715 n=1 Tax=Pyronema omphalodes (strain CBS 100304) TaxID=1076935 RepID=U4LP97_PYROM|nr:hypothetical protein FPQ18DRAFT_339692 [Pyronema domesticum]CCX16455.1 Similar to Uncharacterized protein yisB; acc. no. O06715 [Pyronema omphalodes CBS 100304]
MAPPLSKNPNFLLLRELLSTPILRKSSLTPEDQTSAAIAELGDFIDYLAQVLFTSLDESLQSLNPGDPVPELSEEPDYPPELTDSLHSYDLTSNAQLFLQPVLESYIKTATTAPVYKDTRTEECEICERMVPLTYHHLIPREVHKKVLKRGWHQEWELNKVAWLCRPCHSTVHRVATNEELAKEWFTVEKLLEREDIGKWRSYVGKQRWGGRGAKGR